jgi:hypothetical protein
VHARSRGVAKAMCTGPRGRSCMASLQTAAARKRKQRARVAGAAAPGRTGHSSAAHPPAAPAAGAARTAARTSAPARGNQDVTRVVQRGRAGGDAAAAPARSAEQRESASMWLLAERACGGSDPAAGRLRHGTSAGNDVDMSDGSHAPGSFDSASAPDDAAGNGLHAGGACCLSPAVLLLSECCQALM